ncbi:hypothetical protein STEG23_015669, partial [Scotinomys teguina]
MHITSQILHQCGSDMQELTDVNLYSFPLKEKQPGYFGEQPLADLQQDTSSCS